jgi:pyruvate,water dikinase
VTYRVRNRVDHAHVAMAVVVQHMVVADAAGVMFTADPVTSNRKVVSVEATFGLGEALVAGRVNPDVYTVRDGEVVARSVGRKHLAVRASRGGGTHEQEIAPALQDRPVLRDADVVRLAHLGRRIEAHLGRPQDIEWCLAGDEIQIVQSRPITTLFPVPVVGDGEDHVFVSVGHQQMMTDPMRPLGISMWQLTAGRPMHEAGGRLFVDVSRGLADPVSRAGLLEGFGRSDPLIADALQTIVDRGVRPSFPDEDPGVRPPDGGGSVELETDPAIVRELIGRTEASVAAVRRDIRGRSGEALIDFILADVAELRRTLFDPRSLQVVMAGMEARWWLDDHLREWLDEQHAADRLTQSVPDNVTSEMGLALLDVADAVRPHPEVVAFLHDVTDERFLDDLPALAGGEAARDAICAYLGRFGMRCVGEIDITRPRWSERPSTLLPLILGHVENVAAGERERRFERGRQEAARKERELLARVRALPGGEHKADETKRMIDRLRTFSGYREHPKYGMISRYAVYRQALVDEAARLVDAGVLRDRDDIFFLTLAELHDVVRARHVDHELITRRRDAFRSYHALTPPRVLTSDGEVVTGASRRDDVPVGALVGLAVSAGTIEGRARVVVDIAEADLRAGDILVTAFTDPSWSPLFVAIGGPRDRGRRPHDPRGGDRPGVRHPRRRRCRARNAAPPGRTAHPGRRDARAHRDPPGVVGTTDPVTARRRARHRA